MIIHEVTLHLNASSLARLNRLYEIRKWDSNKVSTEEAIIRAISIAWLALDKHR